MGLITRSYDFVNGTIANGDEVDTDINKIYTELNGNIDDANIKPSASIAGSKLAAGSVGTTQLTDDSVDNNKLKDDAAVDANRAVTTNHIRDNNVTTAKIAQDGVQARNVSFATTADFSVVVPGLGTVDTLIDTGINKTSFPIANVFLSPTNAGLGVVGKFLNQPITALLYDDGTTNWKIKVIVTAGVTGGTLVLRLRYISGTVHP